MVDISYPSPANTQIHKSKFLAGDSSHLSAFIVQSRKQLGGT